MKKLSPQNNSCKVFILNVSSCVAVKMKSLSEKKFPLTLLSVLRGVTDLKEILKITNNFL